LTEGVQIPPAVKKRRRKKPTMNDHNTNPYWLECRPEKQGPRPLPSDQSRVEKLATRKHLNTKYTTGNTQRLKLVKNTLTVGTWNVQTLWAAGKLELLRNEMKRFGYDIIGISEVRWTGKGETLAGDFIWSGEEKIYMRGVGFLLSSEEDIEAFYSDIDDALAKTAKQDIIILTGDWNAKVGDDNIN
jgi:hypothetical protein